MKAQITELSNLVNNASTANVNDRQLIADSCKRLYNLIEEDVIAVEKEWMLKGMYKDLCNGNFAEPFMCEQKKHTFNQVIAVYAERVVPYL